MECKSKHCKDSSLVNYSYCEVHLCERNTGGKRCKNKKIKNSPFCWAHHYFVNKSSTFFTVLAILSFLFGLYGVYISPPIQNYLNGKLIIDFKENEITIDDNGRPAVKIEVLNRLGKDLLFVNGTATLTCEGMNRKIESQTFKLKGGHDFLGDGSNAEFFLSPDPLFVDIVKSKNNQCADAYFDISEYTKINTSNAKLEKVYLYYANIKADGEYQIIDRTYAYDPQKNYFDYQCKKCNISIKISSLNYKPVFDNESHYFVANTHVASPWKTEIGVPVELTNKFFLVDGAYYSDSGITPEKLCREVVKISNLSINCNQTVKRDVGPPVPLFTNFSTIE